MRLIFIQTVLYISDLIVKLPSKQIVVKRDFVCLCLALCLIGLEIIGFHSAHERELSGKIKHDLPDDKKWSSSQERLPQLNPCGWLRPGCSTESESTHQNIIHILL